MKIAKIIFSLLVLLNFIRVESQGSSSIDTKKPNIIIVYTDDMGIGDLSCYNSGWVKTPNIDKLAAGGLKFNKYYSASPVCSPSRAALTTGIFPTELGINTYLHSREGNLKHEQFDYLDPKIPSIARILKNAGYRTAHFGKWHLGGGRDVDNAPQITEYGFDEYVTTYEGPDPDPTITATYWIWSEEDSIKRWERTAYFVDKTLDFLSRNRNMANFINLWPDDMHDPWIPSSAYFDKKEKWTSKEAFVPVLVEYDKQIGRLMEGLKKLGIFENTLVIFTSDNGAYPTFDQIRTNSERGAKNSLFEGGIRMPFIAHWPAKIPPGKVNDESILCAVDILPTLCAITGAHVPREYNGSGENMTDALLGAKVQLRKKDLMWDFGRNEYFNEPKQPHHQSPHLAIRRGEWKLLINSDSTEIQLYNVKKDQHETTNIADMNPEIASQLSHKVINWYRTKRKIRVEKIIKG